LWESASPQPTLFSEEYFLLISSVFLLDVKRNSFEINKTSAKTSQLKIV